MDKEVKEDAYLTDYNNRIESSLMETKLWERARQLEPPAGRFLKGYKGIWMPLEYPGYTIITPPFEEEDNPDNLQTYEVLCDVQQFILERLNPVQYAPATKPALHLTLCDLVSGDKYKENVDGPKEQAFRQVLASCFDELSLRGTIKMNILGVSIFPGGFIIALAGIENEESYKRLKLFRETIYQDEELRNFGVERKFKFTGHVTLAYAEDGLSPSDKDQLAKTLVDVKRRFWDDPLPFNVVRAEVRKFDNLARFYRCCEGWPVFLF